MGHLYKEVGTHVNEQLMADEIIIEIGSDRFEGSTYYFADLAQAHQGKFVTVDIDPDARRRIIKSVPGELLAHTEIVCADADQWTASFSARNQRIKILYLDNFDWDWSTNKTSEMIAQQKTWYADFGIRMNNLNCQTSHIKQMINLMPYMSDRSIVCVDDTYEYNGVYIGKGGAVVPYLMAHGFGILQARDYGVILGRGYKNIIV